jgi:hypothetical protein
LTTSHEPANDKQPEGRDEQRHDDLGRDERRLVEYRGRIHRLLAENPNYFGNLPELGIPPVFELITDTYFEEATCVALNPDVDVLEATVEIKRPFGYGGDLCSPGSMEWVRFYISYDDGVTWEDVGVGSFNAHDIPDLVDCARQPTKPLSYTVAHPLPDPHRARCRRPVLPLVRAILSWAILPPAGQPNWLPVWGNVLDHHVQLAPTPPIIRDLLDDLKVKKVPKIFEPWLSEALPELEPQPFSLADAAELGRQTDVPPHRFAAPLIASSAASRVLSQQQLAQNIAQFKQIDADWFSVVKDFFEVTGDTTYEELHCLGLDYNRDLLVGTFEIKLPTGFSGPLCGPGSTEYVAFWVDYDNQCRWSYAGTAKVQVYDFNPLPPDGLHYWVAVPARLAEHARSCDEPKVARIRAVLSWATPPSTTDPYDLPRWGNAIETHIEVKPRRRVGSGPEIDVVGGIPIGQVDTVATGLTKPFAQFAQWGSPADANEPWRECPFGGTITVNADADPAFAAAGRQYRLLVRPYGSTSAGNPVTDPFVTSDGTVVVVRTPDPTTGLTPYLPPSQNVFNVLASWRTRGVVVDGLYEIRLEMTDAVGNPIGSTIWYGLRVDNTAPTAQLTLSTGTPCNKAAPGDTVTGTFTATDSYFGSYRLDTLPASLNPPDPAHTPASTTVNVVNGQWSLVTDGTWAQCGYVVQLHVYDRAIVDSVPWAHNYGYDDVGFCLGL